MPGGLVCRESHDKLGSGVLSATRASLLRLPSSTSLVTPRHPAFKKKGHRRGARFGRANCESEQVRHRWRMRDGESRLIELNEVGEGGDGFYVA